MKRIQYLLPGSPESAEYAHLSLVPESSPRKPVGPVDRSGMPRRLRGLSAQQQKLFGGLLAKAAERVQEEAQKRECKYLRPFDTISDYGMRTYQTRWDSLAKMIEPMLARLDLATMVLGWLDDNGKFHLNRQRGLSEDSSVKEWTVSRTLTALEDAHYIKRRMRRIFHNGKRWITRVTINIRPRFFIDLGLGYLLAEARTLKKSQREKNLIRTGEKRSKSQTQEMANKLARTKSHKGHLRALKQRQADKDAMDKDTYSRRRNELRTAHALDNPELRGMARERAFALAHPDYKLLPEHKYP